MKIIQYGSPRSGTTLLCRIIMRLMKPDDELVKTHSYLPEMNNYMTIISVRDIRDCIVSQHRINSMTFYGKESDIPFDPVKTEGLIKMTQYYLNSDFWPSIHVRGALVLKYEDFWKNIRGTVINLS